jgi:hypothetical protein
MIMMMVMMMTMGVEQSVESELTSEPEGLGGNLPQCLLTHHKSRMT